jgi:hypothetical protein
MTTSPISSKGFDIRVIFEMPLRQFVPWLLMVLIVTAAGYPGVICVTPMAWLLALPVGNLCVVRSKSESSSRRLIEASLAGAFFGFLQGILFLAITPLMGPYQADELNRTVLLTLLMLLTGITAGAILSFFTAYFTEQRRKVP